MNMDQLEQIIRNGFASMRSEKSTVEDRIKTLEVMAGILKQEARNLEDNKIAEVELNSLS